MWQELERLVVIEYWFKSPFKIWQTMNHKDLRIFLSKEKTNNNFFFAALLSVDGKDQGRLKHFPDSH